MWFGSRLAATMMIGTMSLAVAAPAQAAPTLSGTAGSTNASADQHGSRFCRQDARFLVLAHQGNLAEIAAGSVALTRSRDTRVRQIATMLIQHHTQLDERIKTLARGHGVDLPARPGHAQRRKLAMVAGRPGPAFDGAWLRLQEAAHLQTLIQIDRELRNGCASAIRIAANAAVPVVREHLGLVRRTLARTPDASPTDRADLG